MARYFCLMLVLFLVSLPCDATVNIFIVTPEGIAIGADGKTFVTSDCGGNKPITYDTRMKITLLRKRLAVSGMGALQSPVPLHGTSVYEFTRWVKSADHKAGPTDSVTQLNKTINDEGPSTLSFVMNDPTLACYFVTNPLISEFIVAGYEQGVPTVYAVKFIGDWNKKAITPQVDLTLQKGERIDARKGAIGYSKVLEQVCQPNNDYYKIAFAHFPYEISYFCYGDLSKFSLQRATDLVRILIEIDSEINPEAVNFPITVATIPRVGTGNIKSYCSPFPAGPSKLTKRFGCKCVCMRH